MGLTVILFSQEAFPGGDTGPKGRITSGPQEGRAVWSNSARSLGEMSRTHPEGPSLQPVLESQLQLQAEMEDHKHCYLCFI